MRGQQSSLVVLCTTLLFLSWNENSVSAFVAPIQQTISSSLSKSSSLNMLDATTTTSLVMETMSQAATTTATTATATLPSLVDNSNLLLSFADQGQNLAGIFFQASLLPYLLFLYFLSFRANRIPALGNFGFQFVLLFVMSTIPTGIIARATYGTSLANVDWLHGGAETLLTVANVLIVSIR